MPVSKNIPKPNKASTLQAYLDLVPIRQHVLGRLPRADLRSGPLLLLLLGVRGDVADLLFDHADDLLLGAGVEHVAGLAQQGLQVLGDIAAGDVDAADRAGHGEALVDGHGVRHAVARIQHDARGAARGVKREHRLDGCVQRGYVESLEEDLCGRVAVASGVEGWFCQEDGVLEGVC